MRDKSLRDRKIYLFSIDLIPERPNVKNLSRGLNLSRGSSKVGSTQKVSLIARKRFESFKINLVP